MFDFNPSLNNVAPVSPMSLTVDLRKWKCGLLMDAICVLILFTFTIKIEICECCV